MLVTPCKNVSHIIRKCNTPSKNVSHNVSPNVGHTPKLLVTPSVPSLKMLVTMLAPMLVSPQENVSPVFKKC